MSMINDALRRASNASRVAADAPPTNAQAPVELPPPLPGSEELYDSPTPPPPLTDDSLPPSLDAEETSEEGSRKRFLLPVILLLFCAGGAVGFWVWKKKSKAIAEVVAAVSTTKPILPDAYVRRATSNAVAAAVAGTPPHPVPTPAPVTPAPAATPPAIPPSALTPSTIKFPPLRLQSIFYRPANPSVLINGKTLYVSDEIQGVFVADIQASSVTLVLSGQTNVLTLR